MPAWSQFRDAQPALADRARQRLHGRVSYLATVRKDGSPRVHPVTPIVSSAALYLFMEPTSPKGRDLERDPRFALHAAVEDNDGGGGELLIAGTATRVADAASRDEATAASTYAPADRYILFALEVSEVLDTTYPGSRPERHHWRSDG